MDTSGVLSPDGLLRYLCSNENSVVAEEYYDLRTEEMNEPLSSYWINTSHNTYLTGWRPHLCPFSPRYRQRWSSRAE